MRSVSGDGAPGLGQTCFSLGGWMPFFFRLEAVAGRQHMVQGWHQPQGPEDRLRGHEARTSLGQFFLRRTDWLGLTCLGHTESPQQVKG